MNDLLDIDVSEVQVRNKPVGKIRKLLKHLQADEYTLELDHSSLSGLLECKRSVLWKLIFSRSNYPSSALTYGSAMHAGLEVLLRHRGLFPDDTTTPYSSMFAAGEAKFMENPPPVGEYRDYNMFCNFLELYIKREEKDNKLLYPIIYNGIPAVELPFAVPLGEIEINNICPFDRRLIVENSDGRHPNNDESFYISKVHIVWTGIIDLIIEQNGQKWIVDHKTTSVVGESYFKGFELSQQLRGYQWATETLLGEQLHGAMLNVIASRKPSSKEEKFFRRYYPYPRHRIDEWPESILQLSSDLLHSLTTNSFPEETQWCVGKFGTCPYHDVCSEAPENRLLMLSSDKYCDNVWNPIDT